ncbi:sulfurtransferase [Ilumatobacter sp.]|uniref:sulfurtransferase n=1 Tax=Ilumatobacter sp. TaxID=1967498 RepID=UPI003AF9E158
MTMALISVAELSDQLDDPDVVICDVRFHLDDHDRGRREFDSSHLPGARFVDLHAELAGTVGGGRHPLPPVADFAALLGRIGVRPGSLVVAYDSANGATASRLWWMLRSIGHGRAAVLDGGIQAWTAAGLELTAEAPTVVATVYPAAPDWTGIVDAEAVAQSAAFGGTVIDARAPDRFRGENEPIDPRAGHIPGAINRFHGDTVGPDGLHLSTEQLAELFAGVGENPIVYCGSGVTACHDLLAMSTIGLAGARLYPGSWSEWSAEPDREVATGN